MTVIWLLPGYLTKLGDSDYRTVWHEAMRAGGFIPLGATRWECGQQIHFCCCRASRNVPGSSTIDALVVVDEAPMNRAIGPALHPDARTHHVKAKDMAKMAIVFRMMEEVP